MMLRDRDMVREAEPAASSDRRRTTSATEAERERERGSKIDTRSI